MQRTKGKIYPSECRIQRIARRDMKALLSEPCKKQNKTKQKTEESNTMGKTRDVFKKIREQGTLVGRTKGVSYRFALQGRTWDFP